MRFTSIEASLYVTLNTCNGSKKFTVRQCGKNEHSISIPIPSPYVIEFSGDDRYSYL